MSEPVVGKGDEVLIAFLLDRTGSMADVADDAIGAFNAFLRDQKMEAGTLRFVLTLFDSQSIDTQNWESIQDVPFLTRATYQPRAATPLYDAIAKTIEDIDDLGIEVDRVLFVILTDGFENASRTYGKAEVRRIIEEHQGDEYGWDFIFLMADEAAMAEGQAIGIPAAQTMAFIGDAAGTRAVAQSMSSVTSSYRQGGDWQSVLEEEKDDTLTKGSSS